MARDRARHDVLACAELHVALAGEAAEDARPLTCLDSNDDLEEANRLPHTEADVEADRRQLGNVGRRRAVRPDQRERVEADVSRRLLPDLASELLGVQVDDTAPDREVSRREVARDDLVL